MKFLTVPKVVDWRFPDKHGFCERTLDCKQLSVKEVLEWKGQVDLIKVFLNHFDCSHSNLLLRRSEPELNMGWSIKTSTSISPSYIKTLILKQLKNHGYCLLFYKSFETTYSSYYNVHDLVHWSLIIDSNEGELTLIDEAGSKDYFDGQFGKIPWDVFLESWKQDSSHGIGILSFDQKETEDWDTVFLNLVRASVENMIDLGGLNHLKDFIYTIRNTPTDELVNMLETFEFDIHYFRRLRELWLLAVDRKVIPQKYLDPSWVEELFYLCKCWSLIMGVLMKWKRQPHKDYKQKLVDYLQQTLDNEIKFFTALEKVAEKTV